MWTTARLHLTAISLLMNKLKNHLNPNFEYISVMEIKIRKAMNAMNTFLLNFPPFFVNSWQFSASTLPQVMTIIKVKPIVGQSSRSS